MSAKTYAQLVAEIGETFRKWQQEPPIIENDLPNKARTQRGQTIQEREIRLSFPWQLRTITLAVRREETATANLQLVATALEMMRLAETRGVTELIVKLHRQIYPKPRETPAPTPEPGRIPPHYRVLHLGADAPLEVAEAAYRALARRQHPDAGGTEETMRGLNAAIERVRQEHTRL